MLRVFLLLAVIGETKLEIKSDPSSQRGISSIVSLRFMSQLYRDYYAKNKCLQSKIVAGHTWLQIY